MIDEFDDFDVMTDLYASLYISRVIVGLIHYVSSLSDFRAFFAGALALLAADTGS